jgi:hypothetical protein
LRCRSTRHLTPCDFLWHVHACGLRPTVGPTEPMDRFLCVGVNQ